MRPRRLFTTLLGLGVLAFSFLGQSSNTYFGPTRPTPDADKLVKVQISVRDSPDPGGLQIISVTFDGQDIPLQPRDIYGNRGSGSFQVLPGTYKLSWVVNRSKSIWPRRVTHESIVTISPRDLWVQVEIVGEEAKIS